MNGDLDRLTLQTARRKMDTSIRVPLPTIFGPPVKNDVRWVTPPTKFLCPEGHPPYTGRGTVAYARRGGDAKNKNNIANGSHIY
jgi:hypothetical protein